jgi:hypothetical protein
MQFCFYLDIRDHLAFLSIVAHFALQQDQYNLSPDHGKAVDFLKPHTLPAVFCVLKQ